MSPTTRLLLVVLIPLVAAAGCDTLQHGTAAPSQTEEDPDASAPADELGSFDAGIEEPHAAEPVAPQAEPVCDGSDEIRLMFESGGGHVDDTYAFTNPYGSSFFSVDGRCQFYVGGDHRRGIRTGLLDPESRAELQADLADGLPALEQQLRVTPPVPSQCFDGGGQRLSLTNASIGCACGTTSCPSAASEVLQLAYAWHMRLWALGEDLEGPVRVASAHARENARRHAFAWPLSWELSELDEGMEGFSVDSGRLVEDAADARALRKLREQALRADELASGIYIQTENGARDVFVRSELPDSVLEQRKRFTASQQARFQPKP